MKKVFWLLLVFSFVSVVNAVEGRKYPSQYIDNYTYDEDLQAQKVVITGGSNFQYAVVISSGVTPITFNDTSLEVYVLKKSTMEAFVCWTSTAMPMTSYTTNYFMLPETDVNNAYEYTQAYTGTKMSIFVPQTLGVNPNIRVQIKLK